MSDRTPDIYDAFTFSTELDLLELRLELLAPVVHRFVLVEAPRTHSGQPKPLHFAENRDRFARFADKVIHVVVDDLPPPVPDRWVPEVFQRNAITRGLTSAAPDDLVVVTDVDEIPDPSVLQRLQHETFTTATLEMRMAYYRANWESTSPWPLARITRAGRLESPQSLRLEETVLRVEGAGAHFSSLMDPREIVEKYRSFAHAELDTERFARPAFLQAMQGLRIFAPSRETLVVRPPEHLSPVQAWVLEQDPSLFDFEPAPRLRQRLGVTWANQRARRRLPERLVALGDRALASTLTRRLVPRGVGPQATPRGSAG